MGEFATDGAAVHLFDQIHADALSYLRKERLGFVVLLRGNREFIEGEPMIGQTAFAVRGTSKQELRDFLEMVIEFANRQIAAIDELNV